MKISVGKTEIAAAGKGEIVVGKIKIAIKSKVEIAITLLSHPSIMTLNVETSH